MVSFIIQILYLNLHVLLVSKKNESIDLLIKQFLLGSIKLFGHLAHWKPAEMINKYSSMLKKIFGKICESDLTAFSVAFDTLSYIGETNEGKLILDSIGNSFKSNVCNT